MLLLSWFVNIMFESRMKSRELKEGVYAVGTIEVTDEHEQLSNTLVKDYSSKVGGCPSVLKFYRLQLGQDIFYSKLYTRVKKETVIPSYTTKREHFTSV